MKIEIIRGIGKKGKRYQFRFIARDTMNITRSMTVRRGHATLSALESMQLVRVQTIFARFLSRFHLSHFRSFFALIACLVCALLGTESDAARAWVVCRIVVFKYHCRRQAPLQRKLLHRGKCHRRKRRSLRLPWRVGRPAEATAECRHR